MDDPFLWAILPLKYFFNSPNMRWSLGAHDICFKNKYVTIVFCRALARVLI